MPYNGYANYETWNANMFLGLEPFYSMLEAYCRYNDDVSYTGFVEWARLSGTETPDGVPWNAPALDTDRLDESVREYRADTFGFAD